MLLYVYAGWLMSCPVLGAILPTTCSHSATQNTIVNLRHHLLQELQKLFTHTHTRTNTQRGILLTISPSSDKRVATNNMGQ